MYVSTIDLYQWLLQRLYHPHPSPCPHLGSLHVLSHPFASFKCSRLWPCSGVLSFYYASSFYFFPNGHRQISLTCIRGLLMDFECLFMCLNSLKIHKLSAHGSKAVGNWTKRLKWTEKACVWQLVPSSKQESFFHRCTMSWRQQNYGEVMQ